MRNDYIDKAADLRRDWGGGFGIPQAPRGGRDFISMQSERPDAPPIWQADGSPTSSYMDVLTGPWGQSRGYTPARDEGFLKEFGKGVVRGFVEWGQGTAQTLGAQGTSEDLEYFLRNNRQLYDSERKGVWSYIGNVGGAAIGQNVPFLAATAATTALTGGLAGGPLAAANALQKGAKVGTAAWKAASIAAGKEGGKLALKKQLAGRVAGFTSTFVSQHGNNLREMRERLPDMPDSQRMMLATVVSGIQSYLEIALGGESQQLKALAQYGTGQVLAKRGAFSFMNRVVGGKLWGRITRVGNSIPGRILRTGGEETIEEVLQHATQELAVGLTRKGGYDKTAETLVNEFGQIIKETFIGGLFIGAIPATLNAISDYNHEKRKAELTKDPGDKEAQINTTVVDGVPVVNAEGMRKTQGFFDSLFEATGLQDSLARRVIRNFFINLAYEEWSAATPEDRATIRPEVYFQDVLAVVTKDKTASAALSKKLTEIFSSSMPDSEKTSAIVKAINAVHSDSGAKVNRVMELAQIRQLNDGVMPTWRELAKQFTGNEEAGWEEVLEEVGRKAAGSLSTEQRELIRSVYDKRGDGAVLTATEMLAIFGDLNSEIMPAVATGWMIGVGPAGNLSLQIVANQETGEIYGVLHNSAGRKAELDKFKRSMASTGGGVKADSAGELAKAKARSIYVGAVKARWDAMNELLEKRDAFLSEARQRGGEALQRVVTAGETAARGRAIEDALRAREASAELAEGPEAEAQRAKWEQKLSQQRDEAALKARDMVAEFKQRYGESPIGEQFDKAKREKAGERVEVADGSKPLSLNTLEALGDVEVMRALGLEGGTIALELQRQFDAAWAAATDDATRADAVRDIYARAKTFAPVTAPSSVVDPQIAAAIKYMEGKLRGAKGGRKLMMEFEEDTSGGQITGMHISLPGDSIVMLFAGHDPATVMHELMHHMIDNGLLPVEMRKVLWRNFVSGANVPDRPDLSSISISAQENIANSMLAYILDNKVPEGDAELAESFRFMKSVIATSAREVMVRDGEGFKRYQKGKGDEGAQKFLALVRGAGKDAWTKNPVTGERIPLTFNEESLSLLGKLLAEPASKSKIAQIYGEALSQSVKGGAEAAVYDSRVMQAYRRELAGKMNVSEDVLESQIVARHGREILNNPYEYQSVLLNMMREQYPGVQFRGPQVEMEEQETPTYEPRMALPQEPRMQAEVMSPAEEMDRDAFSEWAKKTTVVSGAVLGSDGKVYPSLPKKGAAKLLGHPQAVALAIKAGVEPIEEGALTSDGRFVRRETAALLSGSNKGGAWGIQDIKAEPTLPKNSAEWGKVAARVWAMERGVRGDAVAAHDLMMEAAGINGELERIKRYAATAKEANDAGRQNVVAERLEMIGEFSKKHNLGEVSRIADIDAVLSGAEKLVADKRAEAKVVRGEAETTADTTGLDRKGMLGRIFGLYTDGDSKEAKVAAQEAIALDVKRMFGDHSRPGHKTGLSQLSDDQLAILIEYKAGEKGERLSAVRRLPPETQALAAEITPEAVRDVGRRAERSLGSKIGSNFESLVYRFISKFSNILGLAEIMARNNPDSVWNRWFAGTIVTAREMATSLIRSSRLALDEELKRRGVNMKDVLEYVEVKDANGVSRRYTASEAMEVWVRTDGGRILSRVYVDKDGVKRRTEIGRLLDANPLTSDSGVDEAIVNGLLEYMRGKPNLIAIVDVTQKFANEAFDRARQAYYKATGRVIKPVTQMYTRNIYSEQVYDQDDVAVPFLNWDRTSEKKGQVNERDAFKHRAPAGGERMNMDYFGKIFRHIDEMNKYSQMAVPMNSLLIALESDVMADAIKSRFGDLKIRDAFIDLLKREMSPYDHLRAREIGASVTDGVINNLTTSALAMNPMPVFTQQATWGPAVAVLGVKAVPRLLRHFAEVAYQLATRGSIVKTDAYQFALAHNPSVVASLWPDRAIEEQSMLLEKIGFGEMRFHNQLLINAKHVGMRPMGASDMLLRLATYVTAFETRMDELNAQLGRYGEAERQKMASDWALKVVRDSHNPSTPADRSLLQSEASSLMRGLMRFQAQPFANMNLFVREVFLPSMWAYKESGILGVGKKLATGANIRRLAFGALLPGVVLGAVGRRRFQDDMAEVLQDAFILGIGNLVPIVGGSIWLSSVAGWGDRGGVSDMFTGWLNTITGSISRLLGERPSFQTIKDAVRVGEGLTGVPHWPLKLTMDLFNETTLKGGDFDGETLLNAMLGKKAK